MTHLLTDAFGRSLTYLRISVTDQCNFKCVYCSPPEGMALLPREDVLSFDEIERVARIFLEMGGRKIRITGGEPLVRPNLERLVARIASLPGLEDFALTTNGSLLEKMAAPLKTAGLHRVNVSIDSLKRERFTELTCVDQLARVWRGIEMAMKAGLRVKLNAVAVKGLTEEEIIAFGDLAKRLPIEVRFIEFMPLCGTGWNQELMYSVANLRQVLETNFSLEPITRGSDCAQTHRIVGGKGMIGIIASMTEPFCKDCTRLRLTADGRLRPCLFSNIKVDVKSLLRHGGTDDELRATIREAVTMKPAGHGIQLPLSDATALPRIKSFGG